MSKLNPSDYRFCVAPMMDWTDRHDRFFLRQITRRARLYTEMVTADAVLHGDRTRLLGFHAAEHPLALQLGGSDADKLAKAAEIAQGFGYDEINLNVGCPSDRVQSGRFGACLMQEPDLVAACVAAMRRAVDMPVTVKCRIGVDDQEPEQALFELVEKSAMAGCRIFIIHARKAWLQGLSPKQNRDIPPLDYELVYRLKQAHPELVIVINGGIETLEQAESHLAFCDGVMLGRAAYKTPYLLAGVDARFYGETEPAPSREQVLEKLLPYAENLVAAGHPLHALTRHLMGLYQAQPGGRLWRRHLSEQAPKAGADVSVLREAMAEMAARASRSTAREQVSDRESELS
ncbi:MAG: tRNA dihydrouridine(20/20a) synthase DusA [Parvibaculales bacterium]